MHVVGTGLCSLLFQLDWLIFSVAFNIYFFSILHIILFHLPPTCGPARLTIDRCKEVDIVA